MFRFSERSLNNLVGVDPRLEELAHLALELTKVDFGVIEGLRTTEKQKEYFDKGVSKTMNSKHLTGDAIDLLAYVGPRASWEMPLYFQIADAVKLAARQLGLQIRWGGAWHINDITAWVPPMEDAYKSYIYYSTSRGRTPFVDGPHFELASRS